MADMQTLLKEADDLGIINVDANSGTLYPEALQSAIDATKRLNSRLDKDKIAAKLREADSIVAAQYR